MKSTDSTNLIETIIASGAASGYVTTIPTDQATAGDGTISLTLGSPPECAISVSAGGKRPLMKDVNGVYKLLSASIQSVQSWGILPFSSTFATAIGGYPEGAVCSDGEGVLWYSTADDNTTVPGATDATWTNILNGMATEEWVEDQGYATKAEMATPPTLYASSTTVTVPSWASIAIIKAVGGGGSGCSCIGTSLEESVYGAGGGGGAYVHFWIDVTDGATLTLTVGAGAAVQGGTVGGQTNGGDTIVQYNGTTVATAGGGAGGVWSNTSSSAGGVGGSAATESSATAIEYSNGTDGGDGQTGSQSIASVSGYGAPGPWGGGGRAGNGGGYSGTGFGAGGGGAYDTSYSGTAYDGGTGHSGCITVEFK